MLSATVPTRPRPVARLALVPLAVFAQLVLLPGARAEGRPAAANATNAPAFETVPFPKARETFQEARSLLLKDYVSTTLDEETLYRLALEGLMQRLNPEKGWDKLLSPKEMEQLRSSLKSEVTGIGVKLDADSKLGMTTVMEVIPHSGAAEAGIKEGDQLLKIDGKSLKGKSFLEVIEAIRGTPGHDATVSLLRDDRVLTKSVKRKKITWDTVKSEKISDSTALLTVHQFADDTPALFRRELERVRDSKARNLVIDLRGNSGGLFDKFVDCASLLIPKGKLIVTTVGRKGEEKEFRSTSAPVAEFAHMAVLVNGETASSGELLAKALHDDLGATIVGEKTFGKWNMQRIEDLANGYALKFTVARIKAPDNKTYDNIGITPDVEVPESPETVERSRLLPDMSARVENDAQLRAGLRLLD